MQSISLSVFEMISKPQLSYVNVVNAQSKVTPAWLKSKRNQLDSTERLALSIVSLT